MFEKAQNVAKYFKENMLDNFFQNFQKSPKPVALVGRKLEERT